MDDAEAVANRSYQRHIGVGFTANLTIRYRLNVMATEGWLRAWVLYLGGTAAAFWIGSVRNGTFLSDYNAYDDALSRFAPGSYLAIRVLEELHSKSSNVWTVDFGPGDAEYKERFGTEKHTVATIRFFARTFNGLLENCVETAVHDVSYLARALLTRVGALDWVKRRLRGKT